MRWGRRRGRLALALGLFVGASACGGDDGRPLVADGGTSSTAGSSLFEAPAVILSVDRAVDDLHLAITVGVPTGDGPECEVTVTDRSKEHDRGLEGLIAPMVVLTRSDGGAVDFGVDGTWPGCEIETRSMEVELAHPHGGRGVVVTDPEPVTWVPAVDGTYRRCALPGCDPATGQPPAPAGCEGSTLVDAVRAGDVPRRSRINVQGCDRGHAVVDIDVGASACPATEGANPCAGERIDRTFWAIEDGRWELITYGRRDVPGCAAAELPAAFPTALCEALPPALP